MNRMERKLFLGVKCQIIKVKGMMELENHYSTTITVIIHSGKKHQWILKLLGESEMKNEILHGLKVSLHKIFINYRGENKVNLQWRNLPDIVLSAQTPLNSYHVPSDLMQWEHGITSVTFWPKIHNLSLIMKKYQTNTNWGPFYKMTGLNLKKC